MAVFMMSFVYKHMYTKDGNLSSHFSCLVCGCVLQLCLPTLKLFMYMYIISLPKHRQVIFRTQVG